GLSVSRVGGKAQLPAYRDVAGGLRLDYAQFEELESFARLGAELDASTAGTLARGARVREVLKQEDLEEVAVEEQLVALLALEEGLFDELPAARVVQAERVVRREVSRALPEIVGRLTRGESLGESDRTTLLEAARAVLERVITERATADRSLSGS